MTTHRLLGHNGREYAKGPDNPIDADVLIIDAFSMTDVTLAWRLFRAIDLSRTSVVLITRGPSTNATPGEANATNHLR